MKKVVNFACLSLLSVASFSISNCKKETVQPFQYQMPQKTRRKANITKHDTEQNFWKLLVRKKFVKPRRIVTDYLKRFQK